MSNILGHWNKEHLQVLYKGIDITDEIGLCVCHNCTDHVREKVDALLKNKELAATVPPVGAANTGIMQLLYDIKSIATSLNYLPVNAISICDKVDVVVTQLHNA